MRAVAGNQAALAHQVSVVDAPSSNTAIPEQHHASSCDPADAENVVASYKSHASDESDVMHMCSVPIGEGTERIRSTSANVREAVMMSPASPAGNVNEKSEVSVTYLKLMYTWCFPPMKPYEELCKNVEKWSFGLFHTSTSFRRACICTVKSKAFERMSLFLILANCVFLAMDSNAPDFQHTQLGGILQAAELVFIIAFTVEMVMKMLGLGIYGAKGAYFRDAWNVIDFVVVVMGWMSLLPSIENISAMRTVRVLRPLRTITGVEGMRMLVSTLLKSLPMLLDVLILCAFLFLIFGTIGVQTFAGVLRQRCGIPAGDVAANGVLHNVTSSVSVGEGICGDRIVTLPLQGAWFATDGVPPAKAGGSVWSLHVCCSIFHKQMLCPDSICHNAVHLVARSMFECRNIIP